MGPKATPSSGATRKSHNQSLHMSITLLAVVLNVHSLRLSKPEVYQIGSRPQGEAERLHVHPEVLDEGICLDGGYVRLT